MPTLTLTPGSRLGPYEILSALGAGGMGEVYRATDTNLKRQVAIKVLPAAVAADAARLARFQREAEVLAALNHPNIAQIHGLEKADGTIALVMELVEGPTLADRIAHGAIPLTDALPIARQIAEALEVAHERGIIHRDLKPANIKVRADGTVKVLDFGLAKATEPAGASSANATNSPTFMLDATQAGVILGTAAYMSPEQAAGKPVDKRTDLWAFGVVVMEMLTGRRVFDGETVSDVLAAVLTRDPDWTSLPPNSPASIRTLLRRCLEKDRRRRVADIADARLEIDDALTIPSGDTMVLDRVPGTVPAARRPWLAWSGCGTATMIALTLGVVHFREKPPATPSSGRFQIPLPANARLATDTNFSLSPDGSWLVYFAAGSDGVRRVWIQAARDALLEARPLSGTESPDGGAFWSPDSRFVVFESQQALKKVDLIGSPPERICDVSGTVLLGSWNRDGVIIFGTDTSGVWQVPASGGVATALTILDRTRRERVNAFPTFLPDGRHFLYSRLGVAENEGVYVGSLDAKPETQSARRVTGSPFNVVFVPSPDSTGGELLMLRGSTLMAQHFDAGRLELTGDAVPVAEQVGSIRASGFFAASADALIYRRAPGETAQLTWLNRQGKVAGTEGEPYVAQTDLRFSPGGERAAFGLFDGHTIDIWISEFARGITRLTSDPGLKDAPVWSPDGRYLAFSSSRAGHFDVYRKAASGDGAEELLLASGENKYPSSWSRDGRFLLYASENAKTKSDLWMLPMTGAPTDRKPFAFVQGDGTQVAGVFSPDARSVAYMSDESGQWEVYVRSFTPPGTAGALPAGPKKLVSRGGGGRPRWRSDGKELFYLALDGKMMAVKVTTDPVFDSGAPEHLFQLPSNRLWWDVDAGGQRFLFVMPVGSGTPSPFTVVRNWQQGLKR